MNILEKKDDNAGNGNNKQVTIIVNGEPKTIAKEELTFQEIVSLAYDGNPPQGETWVFTVTYRKGHGQKTEGSLVEGQAVKVKDGTVFNVTATDKS